MIVELMLATALLGPNANNNDNENINRNGNNNRNSNRTNVNVGARSQANSFSSNRARSGGSPVDLSDRSRNLGNGDRIYSPAGGPIAFDTVTSRSYAASERIRAITERILINSKALINRMIASLMNEDLKQKKAKTHEVRNKIRWMIQDINEGRRMGKAKYKSRTERMKRAIVAELEKRDVEEAYYDLFPERRPNRKRVIWKKKSDSVTFILTNGEPLEVLKPFTINYLRKLIMAPNKAGFMAKKYVPLLGDKYKKDFDGIMRIVQ